MKEAGRRKGVFQSVKGVSLSRKAKLENDAKREGSRISAVSQRKRRATEPTG